MTSWLAGTLIISYMLGSIPFGLLLGKLMGHGDIRKIGSGNIGATNAMRAGGKKLAILTLFFDVAKGYAAVAICQYYYTQNYAALAALFVLVGHIFPVWLQFKGGKGVATALGVFFALNPMIGLCVCLMWLAVFLLTRISSLSSLMSIGYSSIVAYVFDSYMTALLCLCIAALIIFTHRNNIIRLMTGTESSFKKAGAPA